MQAMATSKKKKKEGKGTLFEEIGKSCFERKSIHWGN